MNYTRLGVLVGALALSTLVVGSASAAFQGQGRGHGEGQGQGMDGQHREAVHAAVEANDYTQLPEAAQEKISAEQFADMVERHESMEAHRAELESVVAKNDFDGFLVLHEAHKTEMESHRAEMESRAEEEGRELPEKREKGELTQEQLQEHFDRLVAYYEEHGELPEHDGPAHGQGKMAGKPMGERAEWSGRTDRPRGNGAVPFADRIEKLVDNIDSVERLEAILSKIADKIERIDALAIDSERKDIILDILSLIQELIEEKLG